MKDYQNQLGRLADKLKNDMPKTPIQKVERLKAEVAAKVPEVQFNNWIPKALLKQVKAFGVEHDLSLKDINIKALEYYLSHKAEADKTVNNRR